MEVTKWLKPSNSGHDLVTAPSVQAAPRVNAKQASHDEDLVKGPHHGDIESLQLLRYPGPSPFARRGPFPSTVNLTCGRCSSQLHQDPAFGGQGSGRREPFSKAALRPWLAAVRLPGSARTDQILGDDG